MPLNELLFSFEGRINRLPYWLGNIALGLAFNIVFGVIVIAFAGLNVLSTGDPLTIYRGLGAAVLLVLIVLVPVTWIGLALGTKRLHDRDKSGWWLVVFYVLPYVCLGIGSQYPSVSLPFTVVAYAVSIWALVELGFLRGTVGLNGYGPDPLERQA